MRLRLHHRLHAADRGADPAGRRDAEATTPPADGNISPPLDDTWVAELWIDPQWYGEQSSPDPLPSAGPPEVVPLRHTSLLVGRESKSRDIHPDIDCGTDNGVSRRHAQLTTDGTRWWVEDLGSSNGTFVAEAVDALPKTPIDVGLKREVGPDDRIYVGSWTRLVIRKAAPARSPDPEAPMSSSSPRGPCWHGLRRSWTWATSGCAWRPSGSPTTRPSC